jgi:asparagine synthase (glutamine-hydrolysing)
MNVATVFLNGHIFRIEALRIMCGIAGIIGPGANSPKSRTALAAMTQAIAWRGLDEESFWFDPEGHAALGFRRLAILDIAGGHQPMANETGTVHVVFNGEIYNFPELHHRLEALGHRLAGSGDTALLPHLYEDDAEGMFARLRGMFAIAVWDSARKKLTLGRDRFGQKPLLWRIDAAGRIHFASELKALRAADPEWQPQVDVQALDQYLAFGYVPAPRTIYEGVSKLPAGHWAVFDIKEGSHLHGDQNTEKQVLPEIGKYWSLDWSRRVNPAEMKFETAAREFRSLLDSAIAEQNVADVPVGVFLSGGVDSSIVAALSARLAKRPLRTFCVSFDDRSFDESPYAEAFAKTLGADHTTIPVRYDAWETLAHVARCYDEPLADNSALPTWLLSQATAQHVKVALAGDGGDEIALGYDRYRAIAMADKVRRSLPEAALKILSGPLPHCIPASSRAKTKGRRVRSLLQSFGLNDLQLAARWLIHWDEPRRLQLYRESTLESLAHASSAGIAADPLILLNDALDKASGRELVRRSQAADLAPGGYLPGDLNFKVDIASMTHSLECRAPFLDHRLAEFTATLPTNYLIHPRTGRGKRLFRAACADVVPDEVFTRRKSGFAAPVDRWLRGPLYERTAELLLSPDAHIAALLDQTEISRILEEHHTGKADHAYRIWGLIMLEMWFREHGS